MKPNVLSCLFDLKPTAKEPESILPLNYVAGAVTWQIESEVRQTNGDNRTPSGCLVNHLFVPVTMHPQVIDWAYTSLLTCHPGVKRTMHTISQRFWWSSME